MSGPKYPVAESFGKKDSAISTVWTNCTSVPRIPRESVRAFVTDVTVVGFETTGADTTGFGGTTTGAGVGFGAAVGYSLRIPGISVAANAGTTDTSTQISASTITRTENDAYILDIVSHKHTPPGAGCGDACVLLFYLRDAMMSSCTFLGTTV